MNDEQKRILKDLISKVGVANVLECTGRECETRCRETTGKPGLVAQNKAWHGAADSLAGVASLLRRVC